LVPQVARLGRASTAPNSQETRKQEELSPAGLEGAGFGLGYRLIDLDASSMLY
jgi:hypothetical protein